MYSKVYGGTVSGIEGQLIKVEADVSSGLPIFTMVGYLASEVKEARERVRIAVKNAGYPLLPKRITVNLSPGDIRKEGTGFDLPIALAILSAQGQVFGAFESQILKNIMVIGELGLDGRINGITGVLPIVLAAKKEKLTYCIVPKENEQEAAVVEGIKIIGVVTIGEVIGFLKGERDIEPTTANVKNMLLENGQESREDFSEVVGQEFAKRAIEVAVSGMHNILLVGSPGSGKTMLAKRIPSIMPSLTFEESIEISKIYSISGLLDEKQAIIKKRPFRAPHHTITAPALMGGGRYARPGEISLASGGVLFLDELLEFKKGILELLRQPLEERTVTIARMGGIYRFPTDLMMVAAMNPCGCGHYPDRNLCMCSEHDVRKHLHKISKPLLDRIDLAVESNKVNYVDLSGKEVLESSEEIRKRVERARSIQLKRYKKESIYFNSQLTPRMIRKYCNVGEVEKKYLESIFEQMKLSARAYHRVLKVARTIADLAEEKVVLEEHLAEAICYRSIDQKYWGSEHE